MRRAKTYGLQVTRGHRLFISKRVTKRGMASDTIAKPGNADERPAFRLIAGDCLVETTGATNETHRGQVLVLVKPDDTVLVHDVHGYKPVAWLTRAESVSTDDDAGILTAVDGDHWLQIRIEHELMNERLPGSPAGRPRGTCPRCGGTLVSAGSAVHCVGCRDRFGLPSDATLREEACDCGLPRMRIERGDVFDLCIDRSCEPMETAIADRFDGDWACPDADCPGQLRVIRRGGLLAGCDQYPECEVAFRLPTGLIDGHCGCGLPRFERDGEVRCLDVTCDAAG